MSGNAEPARPSDDSVTVQFRFKEPGGPCAVVIGPGHRPYYLYADGRTEPVCPEGETSDA